MPEPARTTEDWLTDVQASLLALQQCKAALTQAKGAFQSSLESIKSEVAALENIVEGSLQLEVVVNMLIEGTEGFKNALEAQQGE